MKRKRKSRTSKVVISNSLTNGGNEGMDKEQIVELKISAKDLDKFDMKSFFGHEAAQLNKSFSQFDIDKNEQDNDHTLIDNYEDVGAYESDKECTSKNSFDENKSQSQ